MLTGMDDAEQLAALREDPEALLEFAMEHHPDLVEGVDEEGSSELRDEFENWNRASRRRFARDERRRRQGPRR